MAKQSLTSASYFLSLLIFDSLLILITEVSSLNSSSFFVEVSYKIIIFSPWIIRTTVIFIVITLLIYLMSKICRCFTKTIFLYICYSILFWSFYRVLCISNKFLCYKKLSSFLFILFLRGICFWSGVTLAKFSTCLDKSETFLLSLWILIYEGFSMWTI